MADDQYRSLESRIRSHVPKVVRIMEPYYGLLEELLAMDILDEIQIAGIRCGVNVYEQNNRLLEYFKMASDDVCQQFLTALKNTRQCHVANFIEHDGSLYTC